MPIIRARHNFDTNFTTVPNVWVRDPRISLKAKGLLVQLMSHTPGWTVSIGSLAQANDCGRDSIRSAVIELEEAGYLIRSQERTDDGQFAEVVWRTNDPSDKPLSENPTTDNPTPKKNNSKEEQSKEVPSNKFEDEFERFWALYPRKVEKLEARKAFIKAFTQYGSDVLDGVRRLSLDPNLPPKQYVPYPASWLNAGGWTNEPYPEREKSKDELLAEERKRIAERDAREKERRRREKEQAEREKAEFVPAPRCVHDRILVRCPVCKDTPDASLSDTD